MLGHWVVHYKALVLLYYLIHSQDHTIYILTMTFYIRIRPPQVVFGIGHPITSGSSAIDYNIVSADMFLSFQALTSQPPDVRMCMQVS